MKRFQHKVNPGGWHRIIDHRHGKKGVDAGYQGIAFYEHDGNRYIAVTAFHGSNRLLPGIVYQIASASGEEVK